MYTSKYFTCPEIDQRLKQGYFDDFVSAGFIGTIEDFWTFVLSIKDKPGSDAVTNLLQDLENKLKGIIDALRVDSETADEVLDNKIDQSVADLETKLEAQKVTKVSQLENDLKYQTEEEVRAFISALVNGADESLDTLLELAQALGNDPNFAATVTNKLGELKTAIQEESARAKEKEAELKEAITRETQDREEADANILNLTEQHIDRIATALQDSFNNLDQKVQSLNSSFISLQQAFHQLSQEVDQKVNDAKEEAKTDNEALKSELNENISNVSSELTSKIEDETTRATEAEKALDTRVSELSKTHTSDVESLRTGIADNAAAIQKEVGDRGAADLALEQKILQESTDRAQGDISIQDKISQETLNRIEGDSKLQEKLTQEITDRKTGEAELTSQITLEKTARETADLTLERSIEQLETKHDSELSTVEAKLDAEIVRAKSAEESKVDKEVGKGLSSNDFTTELLNKLKGIQDQANYITKVSELINDSGFQTEEQVNTAIQGVIGSAPEVLDTLQEIAEALGNDPNFAGTILNRLASITTQLNTEIEDRKAADNALKLELLAQIKSTTDSLNTSYSVLEERLNSYKSISDNNERALGDRIDSLSSTLDEKVSLFLEKVTELSDKYSEKVAELNAKVNEFTRDILARINTQDDLINGNSANIQRNLELIQGLVEEVTGIKDLSNERFNSLLQSIRDEADTRKATDDVLAAKLEANSQKLAATAESLEELEQYIRDNPANIKGSSTIEAIVKENLETGKSETVLGVIVSEGDQILSKDSTGLKSNLGVKKTQTDAGLTYQLTGKDGTPLTGVQAIEVPETNPFTEPESQAMYDEIYGEGLNPEPQVTHRPKTLNKIYS